MPAVCIGGNAASCAAEQTQNRRLIVGLGRFRQQVEVTLNKPRDRGASGSRVALGAANHLFVYAQCQLRHIRMIARYSYVSPFAAAVQAGSYVASVRETMCSIKINHGQTRGVHSFMVLCTNWPSTTVSTDFSLLIASSGTRFKHCTLRASVTASEASKTRARSITCAPRLRISRSARRVTCRPVRVRRGRSTPLIGCVRQGCHSASIPIPEG